MRSPRNFGRFSVGQAVLACPLSCFCRETHFGWQGTLADGVPSGPGSENAATIPRDLLPSRDRQGAVLLLRMAVSRQKPARGAGPLPPPLLAPPPPRARGPPPPPPPPLRAFQKFHEIRSLHTSTEECTRQLYCGSGCCSTVRTAGGNLSEFASRRLTCHICSGVNEPLNPGIPVSRMPLATFQ